MQKAYRKVTGMSFSEMENIPISQVRKELEYNRIDEEMKAQHINAKPE